MQRQNHAVRALGVLLGASMATTVGLLLWQGRWREAIPLHLCSLSALAALALSQRRAAVLLDFLWYLGMPGALLALAFPAPAVSRAQVLMNLSYTVTHALIVCIPVGCMLGGQRPRARRTPAMLATLCAISLAAGIVNAGLQTNFLFLAAPPLGTPLVALYAMGKGVYLAGLAGMMALLCLLMDGLRAALWGRAKAAHSSAQGEAYDGDARLADRRISG